MILFFDLHEKFFAAFVQIIIKQYVDYNTISMKAGLQLDAIYPTQ